MRNITLITLFVGASAFITSAYAEISGNAGITSNYLWRGQTQSGDGASVSAGLDYAGEGYYAGFWVGSLADGEEVDLFIGTEISGFDVGYIAYLYPTGGGDFEEFYVGTSVAGLDLFYAVGTTGDKDSYYSVSKSFDITEAMSGTITYGMNEAAVSGGVNVEDASHLALDVSYADYTFTLSDLEGEGYKVVASYGISF